ncbi:hypothetical protein [Paracoccus broussonetiae]|nr:hypothetical protein [Paracoccus sp. CPCC 101403]
MTDSDMTHPLTQAQSAEARLIALEKLVDALPGLIEAKDLRKVVLWLEDRQILQDGQEDPGSVATDGLEMELAIANVFRRMAERLEAGMQGRSAR